MPKRNKHRMISLLLLTTLLSAAPILGTPDAALTTPHPVEVAEQSRIDMINRVSPAVVCMYDKAKHGGGSGVIITPDGYGLTNFHVVAGMLDTRTGYGGLGDGVLYDLEVLGIDPTGDVAMFRLNGSGVLPHAPLGDSDAVQLGDTVFAMGNPFVMSEDYSPTITMGMVTGVHRYQWGTGGNLTYSDCIQTDASINPGNSGGPLVNLSGEVIGINGRISINTRGRFNVGFGYAISSNQIRRFIPALRAGLVAKHGTLLATIEPDTSGVLRFAQVAVGSPLAEAGVRIGDQLISFDGIPLQSANHFVSILGTYPADWPVIVETQREGKVSKPLIRLTALEPNLRQEFSVEDEVNLREVNRVLERYRRAVRAGDEQKAFSPAKWKIMRTTNDGQKTTRFQAADVGAEATEFTRINDHAEPGPVIRIDSTSATRREGNLEPSSLPVHEAVVHAAIHTLNRKLINPLAEDDRPNVALSGADFPTGREDITPTSTTEPWDVIIWKIGGSALAKYSFDPATGYCMRIRVTDVPTGATMNIELMDHRDLAGWVWPTKIAVSGPDLHYTEELSDWEPAS